VATSRVIVDTFVDIGIETVVGQHRAFLNVDQNFLADPDLLTVPADRIVLQLPETTTASVETMAGIDRLKSIGYEIALNGYRSDLPIAELVDLADVVKLDALALDDDRLVRELATLGDRNLIRVAKRVDSAVRRQRLADMGFHYFQGHFLASRLRRAAGSRRASRDAVPNGPRPPNRRALP
jgi:c-di-GMP phosphodiesterase